MGSERIELEAPAKVNLWLRILGKREDGYHELDTRMVPLELSDRLEIEAGEEGGGLVFECEAEGVPCDESNLVVKAVRALEGEIGHAVDVVVRLEKRIPSGAGLGGGSSDAAAALRGVNQVCGLGLTDDVLVKLGSRLGADVAFFLYEGACDCRGIGEIVEPVEFGERLRLLLVKPGFAVPTPWAYGAWADSEEMEGIDYGEQAMGWGVMVNDLERPVFWKYLVLAEIKWWLLAQDGVCGSLMSGSGATVFGVLEDGADEAGLVAAAKRLFGEASWVCVTATR